MALYLSELKAKAFEGTLADNVILITADTIVCIDNMILGKPADYADAVRILEILSGRKHEVITAVCLTSREKQISFFASSYVYFKPLNKAEIDYYITYYKPFDKAGAYGAQDWIGLTGIERIEGSYFNVMGLPVKELY